mgnify:CR=1 FL=1
MKKFKNSFTVEFCHCDSAGIVFYPHFYIWFDQSTERIFKSLGFPYTTLTERFGLLGFPLLETGASYKNACKLGDELSMESWVAEFNDKTFLVKHNLFHADGSVALEGFERRVVAALDPESEKGMKAMSIPQEITLHFSSD